LYAGSFDDAYYNGGTPATPSGSLYVCGSLAATAQRPTLWRIPVYNGTMKTPVVGPNLASATASCSPVTEIMNGANDYMYASVTAGATAAPGCTAGAGNACVYMFQAPTVPISFDTTSVSSTSSGTTARYINISASVAPSTTETSVDTPLTAAQAGTYYRMTITQSTASPAGDTFTYFLRSNAANTTLTCAIAAGLTTCSDTTNMVTLATGALVDVRVARTAGATNLTATFRVQLEAAGTPPAASVGLAAPGGTGGIIVDNISSTTGASQIYYSTLTSPGDAIQASQAGLQ
jgi:hypothetical protein